MWRWLRALHPTRQNHLGAQEILAGLEVFGVIGIERRTELAQIVASIECTFIEWDPKEAEDE